LSAVRLWVGRESDVIFYKKLFVVRETDCAGCGLCELCPDGCLDVIGGAGALIQADACTSGAYGIAAWPNGAIKMKWQA
jgi:uncharacterized Fe-S center protein